MTIQVVEQDIVIEDVQEETIYEIVESGDRGPAGTSNINNLTEKETISGDDIGVLNDSEDSFNPKKFTFANLIVFLKSSFAFKAGIAGGQGLIGGTESGETLTLSSTTHATKGKVLLGANSAYDEANIRLGVGTVSPLGAALQVESGVTDLIARFISSDNKASISVSDDDTISFISSEGGRCSIGGNLGANINNLNIIISTGNVGIGTTTPSTELEVVGVITDQGGRVGSSLGEHGTIAAGKTLNATTATEHTGDFTADITLTIEGFTTFKPSILFMFTVNGGGSPSITLAGYTFNNPPDVSETLSSLADGDHEVMFNWNATTGKVTVRPQKVSA